MENAFGKKVLNLAEDLIRKHGFSVKEIRELGLLDDDLEDSQEFLENSMARFQEYPHLPKLLKAVNQCLSPKDRYRIASVEEFTILAQDCHGFEEVMNSGNTKKLPALAASVVLALGGASQAGGGNADIVIEDLSDIEEGEEKDSDYSDSKSQEGDVAVNYEVLAFPPIAAPIAKESCGKPRCPAYKAKPTKSDGFSFLTPALAAEEARREYKDYKLSKDALSNHTTKVEVVGRNLGTYHARAARMQAVQEVENNRK